MWVRIAGHRAAAIRPDGGGDRICRVVETDVLVDLRSQMVKLLQDGLGHEREPVRMHFGLLPVQGGERGLDMKQRLASPPELFVVLDHSTILRMLASVAPRPGRARVPAFAGPRDNIAIAERWWHIRKIGRRTIASDFSLFVQFALDATLK
jgi:hypothetical protein